MKLQLAVTAALSGVATASSAAHGYLFRQAQDEIDSTSIPRQAARLLVQQRLGADGDLSLKDIRGLSDQEAALNFLNQFGRPSGLFDSSSDQPSQLVILIEGADAKQMEVSLPDLKPSFKIMDPPCSSAHDSLLDELNLAGVHRNTCELGHAINSLNPECWGDSQTSVLKLDAQKDASVLASLESTASKLARLALNGEMETLVILLPQSSRNSKVKSWSTHAQELRRRQAETVIASTDDEVPSQPTSAVPRPAVFAGAAPKGKIQHCYASYNSCMQATANCSGHGYCKDRWTNDDDEGDEKREEKKLEQQCFACSCLKTAERNSSTHWAGASCEKIDVSTPFALFVGFTFFMIIFLAGAIKMLFDVGETPLPGVIGAGVAKK